MEIYYKIEKGTQQIERSSIKSPIDGIVKGLDLFPGSVLKPGEEVLHVVPQNEKLLGETKIPPREIGYIKIGNPVKIKILTYDYARFGSINGKLINISATTFLDADGNPYYKTKISLDTQSILVKGSPEPLMAGMTIECDIITGSKTLLDYLLKPIHRAVTESFHER
jgi:HlyD family type I secretion membrane fusion protein